MDILVLDAPMKFIHGKMVEQGAQEWSRYLANQFNPIGRGTLYSESYDKEKGLRVYLYSATITLECVGESKGYLKVVKAEDTDVLAYHKAIEEGKLLEEKITFVPVYKFQYINTKEHHDVELFLQNERERRIIEEYIHEWQNYVHGEEGHAEAKQISDAYMHEVIKNIYLGNTTNPRMNQYIRELENLEKPEPMEETYDDWIEEHLSLNGRQKLAVYNALGTKDLYIINDENEEQDKLSLIKAMIYDRVNRDQRVLLVAPNSERLDKSLSAIEEANIATAHIQNSGESPYSISSKAKAMRNKILNRLNDEASKHSRHIEELEQMKAECELYHKADKSIQLCFDIVDLLKELDEEKKAVSKEAEALGLEADEYVEALDKYDKLSEEKREVYRKLGRAVDEDKTLYDEILWMKLHEKKIGYKENKELIMRYSHAVQDFEKKLNVYKKQVADRREYENECKELEVKLLDLRRQYLKSEALNQVAPSSQLQTSDEVAEQIKEIEDELLSLRRRQSEFEVTISTRHLDELSAQAYLLKDKVEAYIEEYRSELKGIYEKDEVTKLNVIDAFNRMQKVEDLFEQGTAYSSYLEDIEESLDLEVKVKEHETLIKKQEANEEKMNGLLKKQMEVTSLLSTKLMEKEFKDFLKLVNVSDQTIDEVISAPLEEAHIEFLESIEAAVQQREFKLQVYKEKVAFYETLSKIKDSWKQKLLTEEEIIEDYLKKCVKVIGATCEDIKMNGNDALLGEKFDYVIIADADQIPELDLLSPMIKGERTILLGNAMGNKPSLFMRLYEDCPKENKSLLSKMI